MNEHIQHIAIQNNWTFVGEGWDNLVYTNTSRTVIFRLPKKTDGAEVLHMEAKLLPILQNHNLEAIIPAPTLKQHDEVVYAEYPYAVGVHYNELNSESKADLLKKLGTFLSKLHTIHISVTSAISQINYHDKFSTIFDAVQSELSTILTQDQLSYAKSVYNTYLHDSDYAVTHQSLLHGDISFEHVYYNNGIITVIDWSDVHIADPARELYHVLRELSPEEQNILKSSYTTDDSLFWKRADIYPLLDTFEVLLIFVKKKKDKEIQEFLGRVDHDMKFWNKIK